MSFTLVDRAGPGQGTSLGKAPGMVTDRDFSLFLCWGYLPKLSPWLRRYMGHANDTDPRRIALGFAAITSDTGAQHKALAAKLGSQDRITDSDYCFAYKDRAAFDADAYTRGLRAQAAPDARQ